jgi:hypothetical protein
MTPLTKFFRRIFITTYTLVDTNAYYNHCECGGTAQMKKYIEVEEGEEVNMIRLDKPRMYLGFCANDCGKVYRTR